MQGSLRQRSPGSFELRVFIGVDPTTRRCRYRSMTVRGGRAEAERELAVMVASVRAARAVGVRSAVSELLEAWFADAAGGWAPTTIRQTRSVLDRYLHPHFGAIAVGDVTPATIDAVYVELRCRGGIGGRPLASATLARIHVVVRAAFAQAMRWGWIWDNPAERAHRIVTVTPELHPPTPEELRTLLDHVAERDPQLHVFLVLAAFTGARRAQLLGCRWYNVHFDTGRVSFGAGWVEGPHGPVLTATKTKRRHRRNAGLRPFRLHDLRHFMATEMLHAGIPLVIVSRRLDHRRVSTTLDKYAHAVPGGDAQASATLRQILTLRPS